jgi:hypothetical protein
MDKDDKEYMNVYTIVDRDGPERPIWIKVGICLTNKDGSMNVYLDVMPLNGRLQIRKKE